MKKNIYKKQDIYLPHIHYTLRVRQIGKIPSDIPTALVYVQKDDMCGCTLYIDLTRKIVGPELAHELVHVLQLICESRSMDFKREEEHMGYIMQYLMATIMGYSYDDRV